MDHWRLAYLGMRQIPRELSEFELATFFTYSPKERALIDARRSPLYRLAVAVHRCQLRIPTPVLGILARGFCATNQRLVALGRPGRVDFQTSTLVCVQRQMCVAWLPCPSTAGKCQASVF